MKVSDLLIVGGGINGAGIARDAAGRGLTVVLAERADLASATSSASSKLVHGGLRYLEQREFRLVAEALAEREVLLRTAPHLVRPMRFVMPHAPGLRPAWLIRAGLLLYDTLARRQTLPPSGRVSLTKPPYDAGLIDRDARAFAYSDCWVDDARLVIANVRAAADAGAQIMPRTACTALRREGAEWRARLQGAAGPIELRTRALVNATGPWAERFLALAGAPRRLLKLVQGSHIVVPRLYEGAHAFILQNDDKRVVFVYPYEGHTLIGTTEVELRGEPGECRATGAEVDYLCHAANRYFSRHIAASDVLWSYCGVRALVDDGAASPRELTRDYLLQVEGGEGMAPLLSVLGGKITTYRRLAERALEKLRPWFPALAPAWTEATALPGGDLPAGGVTALADALSARYPEMPRPLLHALAGRHGSRVPLVLGTARTPADLGEHFGAQLYAREVDYFLAEEWAHDADDVLWRRTKAGLHLLPPQQAKLRIYLTRAAQAL